MKLRIQSGSGLTNKNACGEDEASSDDDLKAGESEAGLEVAMADERDDHEFETHNGVSPRERSVDVGNEEGQRVEKSADEGHEASD